MKAVLFDIQHFTINDGPGVRTTVFFKGCPLHCIWCHNPESLSREREYMFFPNKCAGCQACAKVCQNGVHIFAEEKHNVDFDKCTKCGKCLQSCCYDAISIVGKEYTVEEVLTQIEKDIVYYGKTGGVTLSGGEPMLQAEFVTELARELHKRKIHVCMETSGYAGTELLLKAAPYINLFLFDYKATPQEEYKKLTGANSSLILKNLHFLNQIEKPLILRCPMIPGMNDTNQHFMAIANLAAGYRMIQRVEILPYHSLGEMKREQLGKNRNMEPIQHVTTEQKNQWLKRLWALGCNARLG